MGIWAIRSPLKIHCYTCMSFETCWSRLIYTKLSSHRSFVINMYVITMAWRCISPWGFYRSLQRRREMDVFHLCQQISAFWSKNNQKKKGGWGKPRTSSMKIDQFFLKVTTRGEISLRDIAHKITFFQSLACFIFLKHSLLRTLDVNIVKLCNILFLSFVRELPL